MIPEVHKRKQNTRVVNAIRNGIGAAAERLVPGCH